MKEHFIPIKPVSKDLLYTKIADAILEYIKENKLKDGDKLPSERTLAEQFFTSRNSVREALRVLENENVIKVKTGKGAFISSGGVADSLYVKLWKVNYRELLEIKCLLEKSIVQKLCNAKIGNSIGEKELAYIEEPLLQLEEAASRGIFLQKFDYMFHSRIRQISKNSTMEQMIDNLVIALDNYGKDLYGAEGIWCSTIPYHRDMFQAIKEGNIFQAEEACQKIYETDAQALHLVDSLKKENQS